MGDAGHQLAASTNPAVWFAAPRATRQAARGILLAFPDPRGMKWGNLQQLAHGRPLAPWAEATLKQRAGELVGPVTSIVCTRLY